MKFPSTPPSQPPTPMTVHLPQQLQSEAATKIQSIYRAHMIRALYKKISSVDSVANHLQRLIQRQETMDLIRSDEREKLKMNEVLMGLLLKLDSVPGTDLSIREARRKVNRRIIGLQEILDGTSEARIDDYNDDYDDAYGTWGPYGYKRDLDKVVEQMEEQRSAIQVGMCSLQDSPTTVNIADVVQGRNERKGLIQCYSCKEFGHIARNCNKKFCNYYKHIRHIVKECPTRPQNQRAQAADVVQERNEGKGPIQCYSCKEFGHMARNCNKKFCNYCKQIGHVIKECPTPPQHQRAQSFQINILCTPSMTTSTSQPGLTPEMVQQMIFSTFSALGLQGQRSDVGEDNRKEA